MNGTENMKRVAILPGDGIGPEVMKEAIKVLEAVCKIFNFKLDFEFGDIGGSAYDKHGSALPDQTLRLCENSDAILDEDALRDLVSEIVRQELQGTLGERITRNVRKLVRREIHRAMMGQDFE